jgi:hypothetical protein
MRRAATVPRGELLSWGMNSSTRRQHEVAWSPTKRRSVGKLLGIVGATFLGPRLGVGTLPAGVGRALIALGRRTPSGVEPG